MAKEALDEAQIIKDKATPAEIDKTKQNISETESAIENQDVQLQNALLRLLKLKIKLTNKLKLLTVIKQRLLLKKLM